MSSVRSNGFTLERSRRALKKPFTRVRLLSKNLASDPLTFESNVAHSHHREWKIIEPYERDPTGKRISVLGEKISHCYHVGGGPSPERLRPTDIEQKSNWAQCSRIRQSLEESVADILWHVEIHHPKRNYAFSELEIDRH